ncbi:hypothetical protein DsansV1_C04g0036681 [Dioscorea sansibarensis]
MVSADCYYFLNMVSIYDYYHRGFSCDVFVASFICCVIFPFPTSDLLCSFLSYFAMFMIWVLFIYDVLYLSLIMHFICGYCHLVRLYFFSLLFFPTSLVWIVMQTVSYFDPMLIYWITCFRFILFVALHYVFQICVIHAIFCYYLFVIKLFIYVVLYLSLTMRFIYGYCPLVRFYFFSLLFFPISELWIITQTVSFFWC